jgi:hypothetical protein
VFYEDYIIFYFNITLLTPALNKIFQRHAPAALYPVKAPLSSIEQKVGLVPEPVRGFSGHETKSVVETACDTGQ